MVSGYSMRQEPGALVCVPSSAQLPGQLSSPDWVYRQAHILQEAEHSKGCCCSAAACNSCPPQYPLPRTRSAAPATERYQRKSPYLVSKVLDDKSLI